MKKDKNNNNNKNKNESKQSSMFDGLRNNLNQKYKQDDNQQNYNDHKTKNDKESAKEEVTPISCEADTIGWNNWKILLRNFFYGIFMGISDVIPGYSGGTTLSLIGFYESLIKNIKLIFKPDVKKYFWKYLIWFIPFLIAWLGMLIGFSKIVNIASDANQGIVLVFLFAFFALFAIPIFYFKNKGNLINLKTFSKEMKKKDRTFWIKIALFIFGFVLLLTFAIVARFTSISYSQIDGSEIKGVTFLGNNNSIGNTNSSYDSSKVFLWFFFGFLSGFCMLIPGVSGSLILYMANIYPELSYAISHAFVNANLIPWIVVIVLGSVLGIITCSFVVNWLIKKYNDYFQSFAFGLVACSFISIFVSLSNSDWQTLTNSTTLGASIAMIFIALIINAVIFIFLNETHKIDFPKLRFMQKVFNKKASIKN